MCESGICHRHVPAVRALSIINFEYARRSVSRLSRNIIFHGTAIRDLARIKKSGYFDNGRTKPAIVLLRHAESATRNPCIDRAHPRSTKIGLARPSIVPAEARCARHYVFLRLIPPSLSLAGLGENRFGKLKFMNSKVPSEWSVKRSDEWPPPGNGINGSPGRDKEISRAHPASGIRRAA